LFKKLSTPLLLGASLCDAFHASTTSGENSELPLNVGGLGIGVGMVTTVPFVFFSEEFASTRGDLARDPAGEDGRGGDNSELALRLDLALSLFGVPGRDEDFGLRDLELNFLSRAGRGMTVV
jgi:hypothetical protein